MTQSAAAPYKAHYLVIPRANCEHWEYLPSSFTDKIVAGNYWHVLPESDLFQFGVLNSAMHMAWIKCVSGRLQCYDRHHHRPSIKHFPWPITHTQVQISIIEEKALNVLVIRRQYPAATLEELYNPMTMPIALQNAHRELDKAVDAAYGQKSFASDSGRVGFLLNLQRQLSALLIHLYDDSSTVSDTVADELSSPIHYNDNGFVANRYNAGWTNNAAF